PRHFDFHPNGNIIYVINELNSTITVFQNENDAWKKVQSVSTIPPGFSEDNYCADIHVSSNGKFLYGSNRGHNSISVFKIDAESKKLELITIVPSEGKWPRNFTLTKNGKYMLVANQNSNNIAVFRINHETGIPVFTGNELKIPAPVCLEFLNY
ncbi:MAG TPA: beta-propeller fold lactonase family protein, partial [Tangfeifania sp.]|nr:beta-propeller fold lactonase family protein [Tangfeifania sp.]